MESGGGNPDAVFDGFISSAGNASRGTLIVRSSGSSPRRFRLLRFARLSLRGAAFLLVIDSSCGGASVVA